MKIRFSLKWLVTWCLLSGLMLIPCIHMPNTIKDYGLLGESPEDPSLQGQYGTNSISFGIPCDAYENITYWPVDSDSSEPTRTMGRYHPAGMLINTLFAMAIAAVLLYGISIVYHKLRPWVRW